MSLDGHLSRTAVAGSLKQPTRRLTGRHMPPARSCFGWGLHVPRLLPAGRWSLNEQLAGGQLTVAGGGMVQQDDTAALLAADGKPVLAHVFQHVAVAPLW